MATSLTIEPDDFDLDPFAQEGGFAGAYQVFGNDLDPLDAFSGIGRLIADRAILREVERRYPTPALYGAGGGDLVAAWADSTLFISAVGVVCVTVSSWLYLTHSCPKRKKSFVRSLLKRPGI